MIEDGRGKLGRLGEEAFCRLVRDLRGMAFKNVDPLHPYADVWVVQALGIDSGSVQVKTKKTSSYRFMPWTCHCDEDRSGEPREEHGIDYHLAHKYAQRGVVALVFVELYREIDYGKTASSGEILFMPWGPDAIGIDTCIARVGAHKSLIEDNPFVYFDRNAMQVIGKITEAEREEMEKVYR